MLIRRAKKTILETEKYLYPLNIIILMESKIFFQIFEKNPLWGVTPCFSDVVPLHRFSYTSHPSVFRRNLKERFRVLAVWIIFIN